jgi:hypothetical protein
LDSRALHGLAGEIVCALEPHTEADPAALLISLLVAFGSAVGSGPHARVGGTRHPARLFTVVVGETARARKGQSLRDIRQVLDRAEPDWATACIVGGLASGEGLINHVANDEFGHGGTALVVEEEFARILAVQGREGNTLSEIVRQCWDDGNLRVMTKKPIYANDAHVSIIGHVTLSELTDRLARTDISNGFANRFLYVCVRRSKRLPTGGNIDTRVVDQLATKMRRAIEVARRVREVRRTEAAEYRWAELYDELGDDDAEGLLGEATARAEAQVLRLSVAYALLDEADEIDVEHLDAAAALWDYCHASATYVFGDLPNNRLAETLYAALVAAGEAGLDGAQQHRAVGGHTKATDLRAARRVLVEQDRAVEHLDRTGGRARTMLLDASTEAAKEAKEANSQARSQSGTVSSLPSPVERQVDPTAPLHWRADRDVEDAS